MNIYEIVQEILTFKGFYYNIEEVINYLPYNFLDLNEKEKEISIINACDKIDIIHDD